MHQRLVRSIAILWKRSFFFLPAYNVYTPRATSLLLSTLKIPQELFSHLGNVKAHTPPTHILLTHLLTDYGVDPVNGRSCSISSQLTRTTCRRSKIEEDVSYTRVGRYSRDHTHYWKNLFLGSQMRQLREYSRTTITIPLRHFSVVSTVHSSVSEVAERQRDKEMKEDRILEDEEFSQEGMKSGENGIQEEEDYAHYASWDGSSRRGTGFSFWPSCWFPSMIRSLANYANALEHERKRINWVLYERRQLLGSLRGSSIVCRPTNMKAVVEKVAPLTSMGNSRDAVASTPPQFQPNHPGTKCSQREASSTPPSPLTHSPADVLLCSPYLAWRGSSFAPLQIWKSIRAIFTNMKDRKVNNQTFPNHLNHVSSTSSTAVTTLTEDLDYLRTHRDLHLLSYYRRLQLTPKRNIWHALFHTVWNMYVSVMNAIWSVFSYPFHSLTQMQTFPTNSASTEATEDSSLFCGSSMARRIQYFCGGVFQGAWVGMEFLAYGFLLSPFLHLTTGVMNSMYGVVNFLTGKYMFDALSGRYMKCTVLDTQLLRGFLQREKRLIRAIGRMEFRRRKLKSEDKWTKRMASMGFSMENLQEQLLKRKGKQARSGVSGRTGESDGDYHAGKRSFGAPKTKKVFNPYDVLHVKRTAPLATIKAQYKKLAMVFHPDVAQSTRRDSGGSLTDEERRQTQERFEEISRAYQILSNREKRRAYDMSGESGLAMHEGKYGEFLQRTPEEVVQRLFGGEAFRYLLVGELLRSHWALRYEAQVSVSLHDLEELQSIRVRQVASELAWMADVHAMEVESTTSPCSRPSSTFTPTACPPSRSSSSIRASLPTASFSSSSSMNAFRQTSRKKKPGASAFPTSSTTPTASSSSSSAPLLPINVFLPFASHIPQLEPGSNPYADFSQQFMDRCEAFVARLTDACFGRELLHEVGLAYVSGSQRFLGLTPFYAPKVLVTKKIFSGIDRIWYAFQEKAAGRKDDPASIQTVARKVMVEYFHMEYDNVVADLHVCLRFAVQTVLQDVTVSEKVRKRRCYAVWYIGQKMLEKGVPFGTARKDDDDAEMMAYIQQAANSSATVTKPKSF